MRNTNNTVSTIRNKVIKTPLFPYDNDDDFNGYEYYNDKN